MKKFLLTVLAVIVGGIILSLLPFFIMAGVAASMGDDTVKVKENSALVYNLETAVTDVESNDPMAVLANKLNGVDGPSIALRTLLDNIDKAVVDDNIKCIVLEGSASGAAAASVREIRDHLNAFKQSGKPIYYFANSIEQSALYIGSVADKIYVAPEGNVALYGAYTVQPYFKDFLDKFNIDVQIIRHGKFKSAVEPYMLNGMSEASRLQSQRYVDGMWNTVRADIASSRGIDEKVLDQFVEDMNYADTKIAKAVGIVDDCIYRDQFLDILKEALNVDKSKDINKVAMTSYAKAPVYRPEKTFATRKIALITASGEIFDGSNKSDDQNIYGDDLAAAIREARNDESIEAIVMRVNSPGGSAMASDIIWREVKLASEAKPFIVSMGQYAASGGYYISCAADYIFAQPNTLTGSIGVFGMIPCVKRAADKFGVHFDGVSSHSEMVPSYISPLSERQKAYFQRSVEKTYDTFTSRCADGRNCSQEHIDSIGQGRVWIGSDAINIGLVDQLGSLDDAIAMAKSMVGIEGEANVVTLPEPQDPMTKMLRQMGMETKATIGKMVFGETYEYVNRAQNLMEKPTIQARIEEDLVIGF